MTEATDWIPRIPSPSSMPLASFGLGDPGLPPPEWTLDELLGTSSLPAADVQIPLIASAEKFASYALRPGSPHSLLGDASPWQQGSNSTPSEEDGSKEQQKQSTRARNRAAQAKSRARKREREKQVQDEVQELSASLRSTERHKNMLQRSSWLLTAAVREGVRMQGPTTSFVPSRGLAGWDPRSTLDLREAFSQPLCISPANICSMEYATFQRIWQEIVSAMLPHLPTAIAEPFSSAARSIEALAHELSALAGYVSLGSPQHEWQFVNTPAHPGDRAFYAPLVERLGASAGQCDTLGTLLREMQHQTGKLDAAEAHLQSALQHRGSNGAEIAQEPVTGYNLSDLLVSVQEDRMRVRFDFAGQVWVQVMSPLQLAMCVTATLPQAPDTVTIINLLTDQRDSLSGGKAGLASN